MITDRELLELAAKAAGINHIVYTNDYDGSSGLVTCNSVGRHMLYWTPLTDDGDALRLAVKLHMCVTSFSDEQMVGFIIGKEGHNVYEMPGNDPYAATRRAIVCAAAEIGKVK